jgi:hypothetical protein
VVFLGLMLQVIVAPCLAAMFVIPLERKVVSERNATILGILVDILFAPIIFLVLPLGKTTYGFLLAFCIGTVGHSPRSFWASAMRGWIIDEDIQKFGDAGINKRREATFHSLQSSVRNFGTGISLALGLIYLAWGAGQISINCMPFDKMTTEQGAVYNKKPTTVGGNEAALFDPCSPNALAVKEASICCSGVVAYNASSFSECCYRNQQEAQPLSVEQFLLFIYGGEQVSEQESRLYRAIRLFAMNVLSYLFSSRCRGVSRVQFSSFNLHILGTHTGRQVL